MGPTDQSCCTESQTEEECYEMIYDAFPAARDGNPHEGTVLLTSAL